MAHFEETAIGYKTIFQNTFNDTAGGARDHATLVESNDLSEKYAWLGNFPGMKEWIGDRDVQALQDFGYYLENKLYEASITVPNLHIEYDKINIYKPAIKQMAMDAKQFGGELVADVMIDGETGLCYDGQPFHSANHTVGTDVYANLSVGVLNEANLLAGITYMMSIKTAKGKSLKINPNKISAGPTQLATLKKLIDVETLDNGAANPCYKIVEYEILPEITDTSWYLEDHNKAIKPYILQVAIDGKFEASNDDKFMKDAALFGTKSFMNAGYGLWQLSMKFSGTVA